MLKGVGTKIRQARRTQNLTQEDIAKMIPMNQSNYSKIEREHQEPNLLQLFKICQVLNVSADELLGLNNIQTTGNIENIADGIGQ